MISPNEWPGDIHRCLVFLQTACVAKIERTQRNGYIMNQSTDGAEYVWVSECQKGEGCEIINQIVFV
jgi:hypothetical protein